MKNFLKRILNVIVRTVWAIGAIILWVPANVVYYIFTGKDEWESYNKLLLLNKYEQLIDYFDDWVYKL